MEKDRKQRRSFLKHILAGSAVLAGTASAIKPAEAGSKNVLNDSNEVLYKETEAFKKYYQSLRS